MNVGKDSDVHNSDELAVLVLETKNKEVFLLVLVIFLTYLMGIMNETMR